MKTIIGLFDSSEAAERAIEEVLSLGVEESQISYVGRDSANKIEIGNVSSTICSDTFRKCKPKKEIQRNCHRSKFA